MVEQGKMLTVYRCRTEANLATGRKACPHLQDRFWKIDSGSAAKCICWVQGNLPDGTPIRESLKTRSWEAAEDKVRHMMNLERDIPDRTLAEAINVFKEDAKKRLAAAPYRKYRYLFEDLQTHADFSGF
jgi:hypothetical protein